MEIDDIPNFIHEIRKRPALWNWKSKKYKNRPLRRAMWIEIYKIVFPSYLEENEDEKKRMAKEVHMKWKNLRDAYNRYIIRRTMAIKTEKKVRRLKPYVYARQMDFLKDLTNIRSMKKRSPLVPVTVDLTSNENESIGGNTNVEINETTNITVTSPSYLQEEIHLKDEYIDQIHRSIQEMTNSEFNEATNTPGTSHSYVQEERRLEDKSTDQIHSSIQEITNYEINEATNTPSTSLSYKKDKRLLKDRIDSQRKKQRQALPRQRESQEENDDMAFFRSLLPTMQMLQLQQKLTFRIEVMKLLGMFANLQQQD